MNIKTPCRPFMRIVCFLVLWIPLNTHMFGAFQNWWVSFNSYTPASQTGTCASVGGIGAIFNCAQVNCAGGSAGNSVVDVIWYYNTTNSVNLTTAVYLYTNTGVIISTNSGTQTVTLPASALVFPPLGGTYYYFCTYNPRTGFCNSNSDPTTTSTITLQANSLPGCPINLTPANSTTMTCGARNSTTPAYTH